MRRQPLLYSSDEMKDRDPFRGDSDELAKGRTLNLNGDFRPRRRAKKRTDRRSSHSSSASHECRGESPNFLSGKVTVSKCLRFGLS